MAGWQRRRKAIDDTRRPRFAGCGEPVGTDLHLVRPFLPLRGFLGLWKGPICLFLASLRHPLLPLPVLDFLQGSRSFSLHLLDHLLPLGILARWISHHSGQDPSAPPPSGSKVYRDPDVIPMACCDICEKWVHIECDVIRSVSLYVGLDHIDWQTNV